MIDTLIAADLILMAAYTAFMLTSFALQAGHRDDWIHTLWSLTKWPALACVILLPITSFIVVGSFGILDILGLLCGLSAWLICRNKGDDDHWKKHTRRIAAKVQQAGSKLIVVPT